MKFSSYFVIFGLCVLSIQIGMITCQSRDDTSDSENVADTSSSDDNSASNSVDDSSSASNSETVADESSSSSSDGSESTGDDTASTGDDSSSTGDDTASTGDDSSSTGDASTSGTEDESNSETDSEASEDSEDSATEEETEQEEPAVGTELVFDMDTSTAGSGLTASIRFVVTEGNGLKMYCDINVDSGTTAASFWPDEFEDESSSDSDSTSDDSSNTSDTTSTDDDATVLATGEVDTDAVASAADTSSSDSGTTSDDASTGDSDTTSNDATSGDSDSTSTNDATSADSGTTSNDETASSDENTASEGTDDTGTSQNRAAECTGTMPHLYALQDTSCCSDPSLSQCASVKGKKLGCIDKTGSVEHTFEDVSYYDFESACLAITDKEVPNGRRSGIRTPKFISSGPSFFRTFGLLNFNSVNFLSSGTKTVTSSSSTGAISVNFPASSPSYSGGSYTPGFLDTLPHIRLEGLTADYLNVVIFLLIISYIAAVILPLFNLGTLFDQLSVPFSRAGDFLSEKMDVLENKVKSSIRKYNRRYYNNVRRVDYDLNYEYDDDDYYYYVK